jgi:lactate dehydrogenase-like 2-hydroxyacid dehydrogenase
MVKFNPRDRPITRKELLTGVRSSDGLLCLLTDRVDKAVMDAAPNLKVIANYAVGYDNIDVGYATQRKIMVTNTPRVLTNATAELTWALILAVARRVVEADGFLRSGRFKGWAPELFLGLELSGSTLGIIGAGRIGTRVAQISKGFELRLLYFDHKPNPILKEELGGRRVGLHTLLKDSDIISIHLPLTPKTHHLIAEAEFALMKQSAILINTARGPIIAEEALIRALKARMIAGAGLDVYEYEPKVSDELHHLENMVLLPHLGSATKKTRTEMAVMAAQSIIDALAGRRPKNLINP